MAPSATKAGNLATPKVVSRKAGDLMTVRLVSRKAGDLAPFQANHHASAGYPVTAIWRHSRMMSHTAGHPRPAIWRRPRPANLSIDLARFQTGYP